MKQNRNLRRRMLAEFLGSMLLLMAVVGSGIMAQRLSGGNAALALLCNTIPTGAMLVVIILVFGPISGAHFNPAVTIAFGLRAQLARGDILPYMAAQIAGAIAGTLLAHAMFDLPLVQQATIIRSGSGQWIAEAVATAGLILTIFGCLQNKASAVPYAVGLYITSAYWFTASTSFANPAVTLARSLTDTFSGIAPMSVPAFIAAESLGMMIGLGLFGFVGMPDPIRRDQRIG